jgi:hypothetical protein
MHSIKHAYQHAQIICAPYLWSLWCMVQGNQILPTDTSKKSHGKGKGTQYPVDFAGPSAAHDPVRGAPGPVSGLPGGPPCGPVAWCGPLWGLWGLAAAVTEVTDVSRQLVI